MKEVVKRIILLGLDKVISKSHLLKLKLIIFYLRMAISLLQ